MLFRLSLSHMAMAMNADQMSTMSTTEEVVDFLLYPLGIMHFNPWVNYDNS